MSILGLLSRWQACRGPGPGLACAPVPCAAPPCPGTPPTAGWALGISRNTSSSLHRAAAAVEQHRQLVQSYRAPGGGACSLAIEIQETHFTSAPPLPAAAHPGHSKLHGSPGPGDVASCKRCLG